MIITDIEVVHESEREVDSYGYVEVPRFVIYKVTYVNGHVEHYKKRATYDSYGTDELVPGVELVTPKKKEIYTYE